MKQIDDWQPAATIEQLTQRAELMAQIRTFFGKRGVLEVDTPALSQATVTDQHLVSFHTEFVGPGQSEPLPLYLMTSPEFHMKRLLCAGSGPIYQMGKSFRNEEAGRHHNPEFTMLEWYRPGFDHHQLMDEMEQLLQHVLHCGAAERVSYQQLFLDYLEVDPLTASIDALKAVAPESLYELAQCETDKDTLLQLLFSMVIEPQIGLVTPCFVFDFPASQAALARISEQDGRVACRFEVYFNGIELANGFYELADADEQLSRFEADNRKRTELGLKTQPIDYRLIAALAEGLPDCAGVALGVDRLIMLALGAKQLQDVIAFPVQRA